MSLNVLVFPKDKNPYQELLYAPLRKKDIKIKYVSPDLNSQLKSLLSLLPLLLYWRVRNYKIFHLHWTGRFATSFKILKPFYTLYFVFFLVYIRSLGYRLVWTVHNVLPHETQFTNEAFVRKILSRLANAKIVHSAYGIEEMKRTGLDTNNIHVIPHGNYIDVYENKISRKNARKSLGLSNKDFVFLFLGLIREYKGVDDLLEAFSRLANKKKHVKLVVAGYCSNDHLLDMMRYYKKNLKNNLILDIEFIENQKAQYYFNSADIAVLPFKKMTTSGSALLALSFAKPIISPQIGSLKDMPADVGIFYKKNRENGLYDAMERAIKNRSRLKTMQAKAFAHAKELSWDRIADKTYSLYNSLV